MKCEWRAQCLNHQKKKKKQYNNAYLLLICYKIAANGGIRTIKRIHTIPKIIIIPQLLSPSEEECTLSNPD